MHIHKRLLGQNIERILTEGSLVIKLEDGSMFTLPLEFASKFNVTRQIHEAKVDTTGSLHISTDDTEIVIPKLDTYEAWEASYPDGERWVCMPGGEIAYWKGTRK